MGSAVVGLVGVVIGGAIGFSGQALLRHFERQHLARQVAKGFAGEIEALISIVERRNYVSVLKSAAAATPPPSLLISVTREYFRVFEANVDKLGLLDDALPAQVASFYVQASAVIEDFNAISQPGFLSALGQTQGQLHYLNAAALLEDTLALGQQTVAELRTFAGLTTRS
jgi:hypothetical protein